MGYKAGPSLPEARSAEQATAEVEPAQPDTKSHPCHIQPLTKENERGEEEDGIEPKVVVSQRGDVEEEKEERLKAKGCSVTEPEREISGLPPCPSPAPVPDPDCTATATDKSEKVELSLSCPSQMGLEEPQQSKEQESDREHGKEDTEEDEGVKMQPEQTECTVSVPVDPGEEEKGVEEGRDKNGENIDVVEDEEEEEEVNGMSPCQNLLGLISDTPAHASPTEPTPPPTASTAVQLQGAYMWSLELLIAAALCATRDALHPPVPAAPAPSLPRHHGMELLGELAELEIQQRSRESKEKDTRGEL